jgi:long-chain acyl-CoA synthetase
VLRLLSIEGVTMWSAVPTMVQRVIEHPSLETADTTTLRTAVMGGAPVSTDLLRRMKEAFPGASRGVGQAYGLSEAGGVVSTAVAADLATHPGSSGRVMPVTEVRISEPDPRGIGQIQVRSPAVMERYWGEPNDKTISPDRWLDTGDLGRLDDDGFLYIAGRLKDLIIRGGENVAPAHIEHHLLAHSCVEEAAVIGLPHPDLGQEVASVILPRKEVSAATLTEYCREKLGHFEIPSRWWIRTAPLPRNDSGKVLKHILIQQWADGGPE